MRVLMISALIMAASAGRAMAQADLFSRSAVSGVVDLRLGVGAYK